MNKSIPSLLLALAGATVVSACGSGGSSAPKDPVVVVPPPTSTQPGISLLAGHSGGQGNINGTGLEARFGTTRALVGDATGNLFVADPITSTIRKVSAAGVVTTFAGATGMSAAVDGAGAAARFIDPLIIGIDTAGTLYVGDGHAIRKVTSAGAVTTLAGDPLLTGMTDGVGAEARFSGPSALAVDSAGNVFVADHNNRTIRKITPAGVVTTFAGKPRGRCGLQGRISVCEQIDGTGTAAAFDQLRTISVDASGTVWVRDGATLRKVSPAGVVTSLPGHEQILADTQSMASSGNGDLYIVNAACEFRKLSAAGIASVEPVTPPVDGTLRDLGGSGVTVDRSGNCYRGADLAIMKVTPARTSAILAGNPAVTGKEDGIGTAARFNLDQGPPSSSAIDAAGNVYVADSVNFSVRKITPAGVVTTFAGGGWGTEDGVGASARFTGLSGLAIDSSGNLHAADRGALRKISPSGVVTTLAGSIAGKFADGQGAAAKFEGISGVALDKHGNIFVTGGPNIVRKITPSGMVSTLAGAPSDAAHGYATGSNDGVGPAAQFAYPVGIAVDSKGDVFVADSANATIRKITPAGVVTTFAGKAEVPGSADGTGGQARFQFPAGMTIDASDNLFVADLGNNTIRKITPHGVVSTVAGSPGSIGVSLGALPGSLSRPGGLAVGSGGVLYLTSANAVLKIQFP